MFKTLYNDLPFIQNKYHLFDAPFDPYHRMNYHGYEYDPATGLDDAEMDKELAKLSCTLDGLPHPVVKAKLFEFVLDHARIDVNARDWFVGFYNWGRVIGKYTVSKWKSEIFDQMPEMSRKIKELHDAGAADIWPDFDHVIPGWDDLLSLGFTGLLERAEQCYSEHKQNGISSEVEAFFEGILISYRAVLRLIERYYRLALTKHHAKAELQVRCLHSLTVGAPTNLYEALQTMYLFFILCECVDYFQTRSLGNGIDSSLLPFYHGDLQSGTFDTETLNEFMAYFFMQFSSIGNYWGQPMYMGGTDADGHSKINEVSYAVLDIYRTLKIYNPKVQIKVAENTPKDFLYQVFDLIRGGVSSFVFCCEPAYQKALQSYGATPDEARTFEISGCYESRVYANESSASSGYINAPKAVELALNNGFDKRTGMQIGPQTGENFATFDDFLNAFMTQWDYLTDVTIDISCSFEDKLEQINPSNIYSATIRHSLERGADGYAKGVKYCNSHLLNCNFASAVDALIAVKKLCFDTQTTSMQTLVAALDNDWNGYESLRAAALKLPQKYGNHEPESDALAASLATHFSQKVNGRPNARGGVYKASMHSAMQFVWQGKKTGALPDGRLAGSELAKNASPVPGADRNGVTALILSACNLTPCNYTESFCIDVMLHSSAVAGDEGLIAMDGLLMTYLKNGGMALQFNVFDANILRDAKQHPEKYQNLQVRVCGWNVLWNNLSEAEQDAYILRAESVKE